MAQDVIYVVSQKGNNASHSEETDCKTFAPKFNNFLG